LEHGLLEVSRWEVHWLQLQANQQRIS